MPPLAAYTYRAAVLTVSDSVVQGTRKDESGPALSALLEKHGFQVAAQQAIADDGPAISATLVHLCIAANLVVTTGGTGLGPRDVTPEATLAVCERQVPGLAEIMRAEGVKHSAYSPLSRSVCGTRGQSLIVNLPGNPQGAKDSLQAILHLIPHALELLLGNTSHSSGAEKH